jgi:hypothetical protein
MSYFGNINVNASDSFSIDAFGRWRVSEPITLFDSDLVEGEFSSIWSTVSSGTGAFTFDGVLNRSQTRLSVNGGAGYAISQTFQRFKYQPGKSQLILATFNLSGNTPNVTKRVGYFNTLSSSSHTDSRDGIYLESDGVNVNICIAKGSKGTTNSVPQSSWNLDKFDGNGPSKVLLDWSKAQILFIDFEWLGVGRVRTGFVVDGKIYYAHEFNHANNVTSVYMDSPHHSIRYEIRTTGTATGYLDKICSSVQSEGGITPLGPPRTVFSGVDGVTVLADIPEAVVGYRINPSKPYTLTIPAQVNTMTETANANYLWLLCANPTIGGTPPTWTTLGNRGLQQSIAAGDNVVSDFGTILASGYASNASRSSGTSINALWKPGISVDGVPDEVWLVIRSTNNATVHGSIDVIEL